MAATSKRELKVVILGDSKNAQDAFAKLAKTSEDADSRLGKVGERFDNVGRKMSTFVTIPVVAAFGGMIDAASDLNESLSKSDTVFGGSARAVHDFAESAAKDLGISRQQAEEAAGTFGNLFTTIGLGQEPAAKMSTELVKLSADLASFNNLDPSETLEKLRSGLVGEVEPLRALGVNFNAAQVEAKAFELGLADANGEISEGAKVQARYALILDQTKTAQGDFARTADGVANKTRIMKAELADTAAEMGASLLPIAQKVVGVATSLFKWFSELPAPLQDAAIAGAAVVAAIGPLSSLAGAAIGAVRGLGQAFIFLATTESAAAAAAGPVAAAIAAAGVGYYALTQSVNALATANQGLIDNQAVATNNVALGTATVEKAIDTYIEATAFTHGAAEATKRYAESFGPLQRAARETLSTLSKETGIARERIVQLANEIGVNLGKMTDEGREKLQAAIAAISGGVEPTARLEAVTETLSNQFATAKEQTDAFKEALDAALGSYLTSQESAIAFADKVQALSDAIAKNGVVVGTTTQGQRDLSRALIDVVHAAESDVEALAAAGLASTDATAKKDALIARLEDLRKRFPQLSASIDDYIAHLKQIPSKVTTILTIEQILSKIGITPAAARVTPTGARASGGPVGAGTPYLVGEQGRELFVPNMNGTIVPNSRLSGLGGSTLTIEKGAVQISLSGATTVTPADVQRSLDAAFAQLMRTLRAM